MYGNADIETYELSQHDKEEPEVFDMAVRDAPQLSGEQWIDILRTRLRREGMSISDLPDVNDSSEFNTVLRELGFSTALDRMAIRRAARAWREQAPSVVDSEPSNSPRPSRARGASPCFGGGIGGQEAKSLVPKLFETPSSTLASPLGDTFSSCSAFSAWEDASDLCAGKPLSSGNIGRSTRSQSEGPRGLPQSLGAAGPLPKDAKLPHQHTQKRRPEEQQTQQRRDHSPCILSQAPGVVDSTARSACTAVPLRRMSLGPLLQRGSAQPEAYGGGKVGMRALSPVVVSSMCWSTPLRMVQPVLVAPAAPAVIAHTPSSPRNTPLSYVAAPAPAAVFVPMPGATAVSMAARPARLAASPPSAAELPHP